MSFFSKIFAKFESLFGGGNAANVWHATETVVAFATPLIEGIEAEVAPEAVPETTAVLNEVKSDFSKVEALAQSIHQGTAGSGATAEIVTVLEGIKTNLGSLLSAVHVKDPALLSKVTAIVNLVVGEIEAVLSQIKQ